MSDAEFTEDEIKTKVALLGALSDEQRNSIVCSLIGHSNIVTTCFGYVYCGRCSAQIGDSLDSYYSNPDVVIVGHNCETCRENAKRLKWHDTLFAPEPFAATEVIDAA